MEINGKVHPDCPNAPNPFHECNYRCFERIGSGESKKEKKLFGSLGKKTPSRSTPQSPHRVIGDKSPPPYYYSKKKSESDDSPSFSSSDEHFGFFSKQPSPARVQASQMNPVSGNCVVLVNDRLPLSPSLAVYMDRGQLTQRTDRQRSEIPEDLGKEQEHEPRPKTPKSRLNTPESRPKTPKSRPRTPESRPRTPESRPRTPESRPRTPESRPRTPESRPRTPEFRPKTPESRPKTPESRPKTPESRPRTPESRSKTPESRPRTPKSRDTGALSSATQISGDRSPRWYFASEKKAESVYSDDDEQSILLYPEILLSPEPKPISRPTTPDRSGVETPWSDDFSFVEERSIYLYPELASSTETKPVSGSSSPVHYQFRAPMEQKEYEKYYEPPELQDEYQSFSSLSEITKMRGIKHYDKEEMQSLISESYVSVGNYKVRASISSTLQSILDKYGDIASRSKLQSLSTRSYYLDCIASVVLELTSTALKGLNESRVKEMLALVKDVESVKIEVGWLRVILNDLLEAAKHFNQHEVAVSEKEVCDHDLEVAKKEMDVQMKELGLKEKEIRVCREKVTEMGGRLGNLEMKRSQLNKSLTFFKSKVEKFQGKSVMVELL